MDAQQEIFTRLKLDLEAIGYDVYDGELPPADTPYPFFYLGDFRQNDSPTKGQSVGFVYPTIHVWHNNTKQRGTVSRMLLDAKVILRKLDHTDSFSWLAADISQRIFADSTTNKPLLHGVIEAELKFS